MFVSKKLLINSLCKRHKVMFCW